MYCKILFKIRTKVKLYSINLKSKVSLNKKLILYQAKVLTLKSLSYCFKSCIILTSLINVIQVAE